MAKRLGAIRFLGAVAAMAGLTACLPAPVPEGPTGVPTAPVVRPPSESSVALNRYYGALQADLLRQGLLRTDGGGIDTPYSARQLSQNFENIVFYDEYASGTWDRLQNAAPTKLRRWAVPVKVSVEFGASVPTDQRRLDSANVNVFTNRLARVTRHNIAISDAAEANFNVLFMGEDDREQLLTRMQQIVPQLDPSSFRLVQSMPRSTHCLMLSYSARRNAYEIRRAIVIIRAEHPDIMRKSCIHEEMAQGMGLINDSPAARPSIFNDNDEFAFLTTHDEQLLQMLYHPSLRIGMGLEEARPMVKAMAREILGGAS